MHLVKTRYSVGTMPVLFDHRSFGRGVRKAFLPIDIWPLARWHTATAVIFERLRLTLSSVSRKVPERLASHLVNRQCFPWKTWAYDPQQVWALYRCICMHIWMENCGLNNSPDTSCSLLLQATNEGASFLWSNMYEMSTHENSWEHKYYSVLQGKFQLTVYQYYIESILLLHLVFPHWVSPDCKQRFRREQHVGRRVSWLKQIVGLPGRKDSWLLIRNTFWPQSCTDLI